jgi:hypothetical protein
MRLSEWRVNWFRVLISINAFVLRSLLSTTNLIQEMFLLFCLPISLSLRAILSRHSENLFFRKIHQNMPERKISGTIISLLSFVHSGVIKHLQRNMDFSCDYSNGSMGNFVYFFLQNDISSSLVSFSVSVPIWILICVKSSKILGSCISW